MTFHISDDPALHDGFIRYYWTYIKHFGKQVVRSGRTEILSSLGVAVIAFAIGRRQKDATALSAFEIAVVANLGWLTLFALGHFVRTPWLLQRDRDVRRAAHGAHWRWGVLGISVLMLMVVGVVLSGVWFYATSQPEALMVGYTAPSIKDAEILDLKQKLASFESALPLTKQHRVTSPRQQQAGKDNVQTGSVTQGPGSINQTGGVGNTASVTNLSPPNRHLTPTQITTLNQLADSLPREFSDISKRRLLFVSANESEPVRFATEMQEIFQAKGKTGALTKIITWAGPTAEGVEVLIHNQDDDTYPTAQQIVNTMNLSGIPIKTFAGADFVPVGQIQVRIGVRPEN